MQSLDCRKTFAFGIPKKVIDENDEINKQNILKKYFSIKMTITT